MSPAQRTRDSRAVLDLVQAAVEPHLAAAPEHWGPLHVAALVAREAVRIVSTTRQGRAAWVDVHQDQQERQP